jgi:mRNA interferase MazF
MQHPPSSLASDATIALAPYDIVVVPFPFTDRQTSKRRPALVLSSAHFNQSIQQVVLAMITSAQQFPWPGDQPIEHLAEAGLTTACLIRLKLFTLDARLVIRRTGTLAPSDQHKLAHAWSGLLVQPQIVSR